jgi:hypothetical protein
MKPEDRTEAEILQRHAEEAEDELSADLATLEADIAHGLGDDPADPVLAGYCERLGLSIADACSDDEARGPTTGPGHPPGLPQHPGEVMP